MVVYVALGSVCLASVGFLFALLLRKIAWHNVKWYGRELVEVNLECKVCTAGVQWLGTDWGPIPKRLRMDQGRDEKGHYFQPQTGNTRSCECCTGMGVHTYHVEYDEEIRSLTAPCSK